MFENLSNRLQAVFSSLKKTGSIDETALETAMRDIRRALLEADVSLDVAKKFISEVKQKAIGQEIIRSISPGQMIIKLVNDELINILGSDTAVINIDGKKPASIMLVGLQGSGKTTSIAKLANFIKIKFNKNILLVSLDVNRPAAFEQLQTLANNIDIEVLPKVENQTPQNIAKRAIAAAEINNIEVILFDTAGRTSIDENLMEELKDLENIINPIETLLTLDSMTGQDTINVAKNFSKKINLTGSILTRIDGDARGGAALSLRMTTGCPIKFIGNGEKIDDLEIFHPDRIANRILDMGDVVTLVEKAAENIDQLEAEKMAERLQQGEFDLNDLLSQINQMKKMGGISSMLKFIPGMKSLGDKANNVSDDAIKKQEAIILSMTKLERRKPKMINSSRKKRIAQGAGTVVSEVNRILKQHRKMADMMKKISKKGMSGLQDLGLPQDFNNQIPPEFLK
ncbi:signal recognition particle protein [Pelagibacterales bacterium]|jgi:signal recognition particle subunit SRP54|nr:signal recognition particle protein [Pelagibacterales bacterium]MBL6862083.1 signal recognition particle protein [Pelagibacterales bacterium]MDA9896968.1 signal recognition particle protein [Pelagibacterales bacterium]MDB9955315.1 signal recognition particle protein [Pelagibacterales bacterium]|tara:strand:- start:420 stop:1787 length:1368 start_codon:yes stop_codon:yes gene_type:complete